MMLAAVSRPRRPALERYMRRLWVDQPHGHRNLMPALADLGWRATSSYDFAPHVDQIPELGDGTANAAARQFRMMPRVYHLSKDVGHVLARDLDLC